MLHLMLYSKLAFNSLYDTTDTETSRYISPHNYSLQIYTLQQRSLSDPFPGPGFATSIQS